MAVTMPSIDIIFKKLASTAISRSQRGYAILIVRDDTNKTFDYKEYSKLSEVTAAEYTSTNYQYIEDVFTFAPFKVCVVRIDTTVDTIADALAIVEGNVKTGWVTLADGTADDWTALVTWTKAKEAAKKYYKSVVYKATTPDCRHIVNLYNDTITFNDARGTTTADKYCPSLVGILAACNISRAVTNYVCSNLSKCVEVADNEAAVGAGKFILINDVDEVKIGLGINSMTTTNDTTLTEDMKYIDIVEAMDLIYDDIITTFKEYQGAYKNKYDNQVLFISAVNSYLTALENESVLDPDYSNAVAVDVDSQRAAWVTYGKAEAAAWSDQEVKAAPYKRSVFLAGDIKILGAMENLQLVFNMA